MVGAVVGGLAVAAHGSGMEGEKEDEEGFL